MRISDWSSDVCSSDLHPPRGGRGNALLLARLPHGVGRRGRREKLSRAGQRRADGGRERGAHGQIQALVHAQCEAVVPAHARQGLREARPVGYQGGLDGRSEEHTSELQSLMRISYAVFCLKKKKYHIHFTSHNYTTINIIY